MADGSLFWAVLGYRSCGVHFPPWVLCLCFQLHLLLFFIRSGFLLFQGLGLALLPWVLPWQLLHCFRLALLFLLAALRVLSSLHWFRPRLVGFPFSSWAFGFTGMGLLQLVLLMWFLPLFIMGLCSAHFHQGLVLHRFVHLRWLLIALVVVPVRGLRSLLQWVVVLLAWLCFLRGFLLPCGFLLVLLLLRVVLGVLSSLFLLPYQVLCSFSIGAFAPFLVNRIYLLYEKRKYSIL